MSVCVCVCVCVCEGGGSRVNLQQMSYANNYFRESDVFRNVFSCISPFTIRCFSVQHVEKEFPLHSNQI